MLNRTVIMGRFTKDPELKTTQGGVSVCSFSLAVESDFKNSQGERDVDFIDCVAWKHKAEFVSKYFSKGRMAMVEGRLKTRTWTDKEGATRKVTEVIAEEVYFGDSVKKDDQEAQAPSETTNPYEGFVGMGPAELADSDLPF